MKIGIDLNDVLRDYSNNFLRKYNENYDHNFDFSDFELWSNDMSIVLPFKSPASYERFTYETYVYELFAACPTTHPSVGPYFKTWVENDVKDIDIAEEITPVIISPMEYGLSIPSTYVFIGKLGTSVRECFFPIDSSKAWDMCDIIITANPRLLDNKPEGKISVKIETEYNQKSSGDYEFKSFFDFLKDKNNTEKIVKHGEKAI